MAIAYVEKTRIFEDSWQAIYDLVSNNLSDPRARTDKWIFGAFPDLTAKDFPGFPLVIINPTSFSAGILVFNQSIRHENFKIDIDIFSKSSEELDKLSDSLLNILEANREDLDSIGLPELTLDLTKVTSTTDDRGRKIHFRTLELKFRRDE